MELRSRKIRVVYNQRVVSRSDVYGFFSSLQSFLTSRREENGFIFEYEELISISPMIVSREIGPGVRVSRLDQSDEESQDGSFQVLEGETRNLLNKINESNYENVIDQFRKLELKDEGGLKVFVDLIVQYVWSFEDKTDLYCRLCRYLSESEVFLNQCTIYEETKGRKRELKGSAKDKKKKSKRFKNLVIQKCQSTFHSSLEVKRKEKEEYESAMKRRDRNRGNIRFIASLYHHGFLSRTDVEVIFKDLIKRIAHGQKNLIFELPREKLELVKYFCDLLELIGEKYEIETNELAAEMERGTEKLTITERRELEEKKKVLLTKKKSIFGFLKFISKNKKHPRHAFMAMDICDLRKGGWKRETKYDQPAQIRGDQRKPPERSSVGGRKGGQRVGRRGGPEEGRNNRINMTSHFNRDQFGKGYSQAHHKPREESPERSNFGGGVDLRLGSPKREQTEENLRNPPTGRISLFMRGKLNWRFCNTCNIPLASPQEYGVHIGCLRNRIHERNSQEQRRCEICEMRFSSARELVNHLQGRKHQVMHDLVMKFCRVREIYDPQAMTRNNRKVFLGCEICGIMFGSSMVGFRKHMNGKDHFYRVLELESILEEITRRKHRNESMGKSVNNNNKNNKQRDPRRVEKVQERRIDPQPRSPITEVKRFISSALEAYGRDMSIVEAMKGLERVDFRLEQVRALLVDLIWDGRRNSKKTVIEMVSFSDLLSAMMRRGWLCMKRNLDEFLCFLLDHCRHDFKRRKEGIDTSAALTKVLPLVLSQFYSDRDYGTGSTGAPELENFLERSRKVFVQFDSSPDLISTFFSSVLDFFKKKGEFARRRGLELEDVSNWIMISNFKHVMKTKVFIGRYFKNPDMEDRLGKTMRKLKVVMKEYPKVYNKMLKNSRK